MIEYILFLLISTIIFIFIIFIFKNDKLHPVKLVYIYWYALLHSNLLVSYLVGLYFYWSAMFPIALFFFSYFFGTITIKIYANSKNRAIKSPIVINNLFSIKKAKKFILLFSFFGMLGVCLQVVSAGFSILDIFTHLMVLASSMSLLRYSELLVIPKYVMILNAFLYSGMFLSGIFWSAISNKKERFIMFLPLIVSLVNAFVNGARAGLFIGLFVFFSAFISAKIIKHESIKPKNIMKIAIGLLSFIVIIMFSVQLARIGRFDIDYEATTRNLLSHFFGFYNTFSIWWHNTYDFSHMYFGKYTFSGLYNMFFS